MKNFTSLLKSVIGRITLFFVTFAIGVSASVFLWLQNSSPVMSITTPITITTNVSDFRPDGGYEFSNKSSQGFNEIVWLSVITGTGVGHGSACAPTPCESPATEKKAEWIPQTPRGLLVTKNGHYKWQDEKLSADSFSFTSEIHKGINYQFNGHFLSNDNFEVSKPEVAVLKGRLIKFVNGQKVAEEKVEFDWFSWNEVDHQTYLRIKPSIRKNKSQ